MRTLPPQRQRKSQPPLFPSSQEYRFLLLVRSQKKYEHAGFPPQRGVLFLLTFREVCGSITRTAKPPFSFSTFRQCRLRVALPFLDLNRFFKPLEITFSSHSDTLTACPSFRTSAETSPLPSPPYRRGNCLFSLSFPQARANAPRHR